ncbi:MAG: hypothetical protein U1A62_16535 [Pseudomonas sp.]|nr:hypothetical protein [Pseudomonas sp.]
MTSKHSNWPLAAMAGLMLNSAVVFAEPISPACWVDQVPQQLIDVDGSGAIQGAWAVPSGLLMPRLERAKAPQGILLAGYDVLSARRICADIQAAGLSQAKLVFGGRERLLALQGAPAWDWLLVSTDKLAANLLSGELSGLFIGKGKTVVGQGLEKSSLTEPSDVAARLIDGQQQRFAPVVLFVSAEHQQKFFDFFSNNPLPGVFLSFDEAESVRDVLNKYASVSTDDQARQLNYYCD